MINLDPTIGAEIKKIKPAIIVNDDTLGRLPLKIIVPITDWKERYEIAPWMVKIQSTPTVFINNKLWPKQYPYSVVSNYINYEI